MVFFSYGQGVTTPPSEVYVWDLDKTYLETSWHTLGDLLRTTFEKSFQKRNVPGTATLMFCVKEHWWAMKGEELFPLYFVTASPPQLEGRIKEKLEIDEIIPEGMFFKDNLKNIWPTRWSLLNQQVGYKIQALMQLRSQIPGEISQILWGDDSETDAVIYSIYSDICSRRCTGEALIKLLKHFGVVKRQVDRILDLQEQSLKHDPVEKIYINLAVDTDPEYYLKFGRRVLPTYNSFQNSLDLFQDGRLQANHVLRVAKDLQVNYGFTCDELQGSLDDLVRRPLLAQETLERILPSLQEAQVISPDYKPSIQPGRVKSQVGDRIFRVEGDMEPWIPEQVDYLRDYR